MAQIAEIVMPQLNVNDESALLVEWVVHDGGKVVKGDIIAHVETSKSVESVSAPADGYFYALVDEGSGYRNGTLVAVITDAAEGKPAIKKASGTVVADVSPSTTPMLTDKARKKAEALGVDLSLLPCGVLIKEKDLEKYAGKDRAALTDKHRARLEKAIAVAAGLDSPILIVGAGTTTKIVIETIEAEGRHQIVGIVDMYADTNDAVMSVPVIGFDDLETLRALRSGGVVAACNAVASLANLRARGMVHDRLTAAGFYLPPVVHPRAYVEPSAKLGSGVFIHANAYVGGCCVVGDAVFVNTGAVLSHDCIVGKSVFLAPNAVLAGIVTIGDYSLIGMCATLLSRVALGRDVVVVNGASVIADVPDGAKVLLRSSECM